MQRRGVKTVLFELQIFIFLETQIGWFC